MSLLSSTKKNKTKKRFAMLRAYVRIELKPVHGGKVSMCVRSNTLSFTTGLESFRSKMGGGGRRGQGSWPVCFAAQLKNRGR